MYKYTTIHYLTSDIKYSLIVIVLWNLEISL